MAVRWAFLFTFLTFFTFGTSWLTEQKLEKVMGKAVGEIFGKTFEETLTQALKIFLPIPTDPETQEIIKQIRMDVPELIRYYGYPGEEHIAQTRDGYLLKLHRIPRGIENKYSTQRYPLLIIHGLFCSSENFVSNANDSLAFFFANMGYDVWLGNLRGNTYSDHHKTMSKNDDTFWDFSLDAHAQEDLPAFIDYILHVTKSDKLLLASHSLGTTVSFAMLASKKDYNYKVKGYLALAPVGSIRYITSSMKLLITVDKILMTVADKANIKKVLTRTKFIENGVLHFCLGKGSPICRALMYQHSGFDPYLFDAKRLGAYIHPCLAGTSVDVLKQFSQAFHGNNLPYFDYGLTKNMLKYGQPEVPIYNLTKISTPIAMVYASNDALADPLDIEVVYRQLRSVILKERFPSILGTHYDFFYLTNARARFYDRLFQILQLLQTHKTE